MHLPTVPLPLVSFYRIRYLPVTTCAKARCFHFRTRYKQEAMENTYQKVTLRGGLSPERPRTVNLEKLNHYFIPKMVTFEYEKFVNQNFAKSNFNKCYVEIYI
jgi:hypothetical protein